MQINIQVSTFTLRPLDLSEPLIDAIAYQYDSTVENFQQETDPDGAPWAALSPRYAATKQGPGILRESGDMLAGINHQYLGGNRAEVRTSGLPYENTHQYGDPSRNIPARPYLGFSDRDADRVEEIFANDIEKQLTL